MKNIKKSIKQYWIYLAAFALPWIIVLVRSFVFHTGFSGSGSFVKGDTYGQLIPFAYELWDKIHLGDSLAYTWNAVGGIDFSTIYGYFISPFTLIILAVPKKLIPDAVQFVMVMKWVLSGVTMVYFFYHTRHNTLQKHKQLVSFFLGMAFVLSNSTLNFMRYIQFGDVMICFPILLILIEKMVLNKKWKLYYIVLTFIIASNAYMAYEVCVFLLIWFLMQLDGEIIQKCKKFCMFAGVSVLAALTNSAFILTGLVLAKNRLDTDATSKTAYASSILIKFTDFFKQLFMFSKIPEPLYKDPNVYCSIVVEFLLLLFVFININKKKKVGYIFVLLGMFASFFQGGLNLAWHLFSVPNGANHRFSFIYIFIVLLLVLYVMEHLQDLKMWNVLLVGVISIVGVVVVFLNIDTYLEFYGYLVSILVLVLYIMIMILYCRKSIKYSSVLVALVICGMLELIANNFQELSVYDVQGASLQKCYAEEGQGLLDGVQLKTGERVSVVGTVSDLGLMSNKAAISGFVSSLNGRMKELMHDLGMARNGEVEYTQRGGSPLVNALLNTRYILGEDEVDCSDAEEVNEYASKKLYCTKRLLGLGFMVDDNIVDWKVKGGFCFDTQNEFVKCAVNGDPIFKQISPEVTCIDAFGQDITYDKDYYDKSGGYLFVNKTRYGNEYDSLQADFVVDKDMDLYLYSISQFNAQIAVFIDEEMIHMDNRSYFQSTYHVGSVKKGQKISVVAVPSEKTTTDQEMAWAISMASFDGASYDKVYEKLDDSIYNIQEMTSDYIKGNIDAEKDGIMMTSIQAADGFSAYVDGEKVDYTVIGGALIGVPLSKGKHMVEFKYQTPTPLWCILLSVCAFLIFLSLCGVEYTRRKQERN